MCYTKSKSKGLLHHNMVISLNIGPSTIPGTLHKVKEHTFALKWVSFSPSIEFIIDTLTLTFSSSACCSVKSFELGFWQLTDLRVERGAGSLHQMQKKLDKEFLDKKISNDFHEISDK